MEICHTHIRAERVERLLRGALQTSHSAYQDVSGHLGFMAPEGVSEGFRPDVGTLASRPDLVDRRGQVLATDIKTFSLFAEPKRISRVDEAIEKLALVIPNQIGRAHV